MMFHVFTIIMMLLTDVSFSADIQLTLQDAANGNNANGLKSLAIKGIAKYKPGGSAMILSLLIQGPPGIMPGAPGGPTSAPSPGGPTQGPGGPTPGPGGPTSVPGGPTKSTCPPGTTAGPQSTSSPSSSPSPTPSGGAGGASPSPTSASTSGGGGGGGTFQDFEKAALDEHNKFRKVHGSQPMKLNRQMCDEAAAYAKVIASKNNMQHSTKEQRKGQGENLAMGCSSSKGGLTTTQAVINWYDEVCKPGYEFSRGRGQGGTGHFTQVVWNDSVELGIGKADSVQGKMKCTYVVGRYKPLGNFFTGNDDYKKNVKQGSFDRQAYCSSIKNKGGFRKSASFLDKVLRRKK